MPIAGEETDTNADTDETEHSNKKRKIEEAPVYLMLESMPSPSLASTVTISSRGLSSPESSSDLSLKENYNLRGILEADVIGRALLIKHEKNLHLTNKDRNNLSEIIITHFLNKSVKLNNEILRNIAEQIISLIPTEKKATYFVSPIRKKQSRLQKPEVAKGKLVDKHRNKLTALRKTIGLEPIEPVNNIEVKSI